MAFRFVPAGDSVLVIEGPERLDAEINRQVIHLAAALKRRGLRGVRDVVPSFRSLAVYFDPFLITRAALEAWAVRELERASSGEAVAPRPTIHVPVCYGGEYGPDLGVVAARAGLAEEEVIRLHTARVYRVYMLGFLPGFAYLAAVDERIATPRRPSPRVRVPAGSVGIAGVQTGVYPTESPGGWQLIGRTPLCPFDSERAEPFLFAAGDNVQFYQVTPAQYLQIGGAG